MINEAYNRTIKRGDILYIDLGKSGKKGLLRGIHPCLVLQNNIGNYYSPTIQVVPFTSSNVEQKRKQPTHVVVEGFGLPRKSVALLEQFRTVSKEDITGYSGYIDINTTQGKCTMIEIEKAHLISSGITIPITM